MAKVTPKEFGMELSNTHMWPQEKKEPFKINETSVFNSHRQPLHHKAKGRLERRLLPCVVIPVFLGHAAGLSARCCTQPEHPLKHTRSHTHATQATGAKVWAGSGHRLCPSAKPGSSQACACTYVYMQTTPMLGQLELKNRLRHMLHLWSRQILRLFLKIVPLPLWHSCLQLSVSGPIYKPPFNWQSWCRREIPAKTVGLLSSMSISLPEQEPLN